MAEAGLKDVVGNEEVEHGVQAAWHDMRTRVLDATFNELSDGDVAFLRRCSMTMGRVGFPTLRSEWG